MIKLLVSLILFLSIIEPIFAQYATPYLSTNQSHVNPIGAVLRETGNFRYGSLNTGRALRQEFGFSFIGQSYGLEADYINETGYIDNNTTEVTGFRGSYQFGKALTVGYSSESQSGDVEQSSSDLGFGLKIDGFHASYLTSEKTLDETGYSVASSSIGFIQGSIPEQWKLEYTDITASEDVHTSSQIVFEVRTVKWILLLEIEDSNSYDRQIFGFGWDDLDGFAYRLDVHSRSFEDGGSETGVKLTAGFNYYRRKSCGC